MRKALIERRTKETEVKLELVLDGEGEYKGSSCIGFFDHMLELFCKHSGFNLNLQVKADLEVDFHHCVEDIGICMGKAFKQSLVDKKGITRYASLALPMDEALVLCAVDISGRSGLYMQCTFLTEKIGNFDVQLIEEFCHGFINEAAITLHLQQLAGKNSHHLAEAIFKGTARVLKEAVRIDGEDIPSSKGVL